MSTGRSLHVSSNEATRTVQVSGEGHVTVDGRPVAVVSVGPGAYLVTVDGDARLVHVAGPPAARWVSAGGRTYVVQCSAQARRRAAAVDDGNLVAPMPATVLSVAVEAGQLVCRGDTLVTLEAMKMELPLRAPHDGRVAAVWCRAGDRVASGARLIDIT